MGARETDPNTQEGQQVGLKAVGAELTAAREKQQRSLTSVAADLHLNPVIVGALEAGDEAGLPAAAFVRGYIKSYARLLGLDEAVLLARLPDSTEHRVVPLKRVGMRRRISLPLGKWLVRGLALAAVLAALVFAAPLIERLWSDKDPQAVSDALQIPQPGESLEIEYLDISPQKDLEMTVEQDEQDVVTVAPAEVVEPPSEVSSVAPAAPEPVAAPQVEIPPAAPQQAGPAVVTLRFAQDSWVEMEAHGRKLVVGTQRAGSERTVTAEPPITLLLGNAPGVELHYRGEPVDLSPHLRGNVAHLTLED